MHSSQAMRGVCTRSSSLRPLQPSSCRPLLPPLHNDCSTSGRCTLVVTQARKPRTTPEELQHELAKLGLSQQAVSTDPDHIPLSQDLYAELYGPEEAVLPPHMQPQSPRDKEQLRFQLTMEGNIRRRNNAKQIEEWAFEHHHASRYKTVNLYTNVHRVAGLMEQLETDDFNIEDKMPSHISSWARAELLFEQEFDVFNDYMSKNLVDFVKKWPEQEQEAEMQFLDEIMLLPPTAEIAKKKSKYPSDEVVADMLASQFLRGTLPNAWVEEPSYAEDIFSDTEIEDVEGDGEEEKL